MSSPSDTAIPRDVRFIVLEGVDGSGKSTQAQLLADALRAEGHTVVLTREPGGTSLGERLRAIILDREIACAPRAELLMILAVRAQHVAEVIQPAVAAGSIVISDRFSLSSLAYQGYGRGLPLDEIRAADAAATGRVQPDLTLVIDVPLDTLLARVGERSDRFEGEGRDFLQRVITGYRSLAATDPHIRMIDGTGTVDAVFQAIRHALAGSLNRGGNAL
jgi:dTMP kinase